MNKLRLLLGSMALYSATAMFGQGARNIVINEVLTNNTRSIVDEFGERNAWIELENTSYTSYNVRGMFITTDRSVLDKSLSAPERISRMSIIPSGDERTMIGARQHLILYCNSNPAEGKLHLSVEVPVSEPLWIALYNGNGVELIDSVSIPALNADESYARNGQVWAVKPADAVTPGIENFIKTDETKVEKFKREDPYGFAMAIMAMGIVFFCLALLWIFFTIFGSIMRRFDASEHKRKTATIVNSSDESDEASADEGLIDMELYMAVIGMALKQYEDDVHDVESGIITIKSKDTEWDDEYSQMTHFHEAKFPTDHSAPHIPTTPELH